MTNMVTADFLERAPSLAFWFSCWLYDRFRLFGVLIRMLAPCDRR